MSTTPRKQEREIVNENNAQVYTGRHVKVAVVDDGICLSHPNIKEVCGGVSIHVTSGGTIILGEDYLNESLTGFAVCSTVATQTSSHFPKSCRS